MEENSSAKKGKKPFVVMAKPVGSACNMCCSYCYYLHTAGSSAGGRMSDKLLERMIRSYVEAAEGPVISFTWHGGEPTLAGLQFYKDAVTLQKKYLPEGWQCWNNLQTNGLALDEQWCEFLSREHFDVSLSLDGDRQNHDRIRRDTAGSATYDRVAQNVSLLKSFGIRPDLLCTVTASAAENGKRIYRALRELDTGWMQFIPIVVRDEGGKVTDVSVSPEAYGAFLKEVFSEWIFHDLDKTEVQLFSEMALVLSGQPANLCWMRETCGDVPVVEKDGSVFSCDHFVRQEYCIGSLLESDFSELMDSPAQNRFRREKKESLPSACRTCPWLALCNGGCPKDRFSDAPGGGKRYYLCEGLQSFFSYAVPRLKNAMELSSRHIPRNTIMEMLTGQERNRYRGVSRNDPCPCGSGKKFKKCCLKYLP